MIERRPNGRLPEESQAPTDAAFAGGRPAGPFTLEQRPVPALYLVAWLLSVGGALVALIGVLAGSRTWSPPLVLGGLFMFGAGLTAAAGYQLVARRNRPEGAYRGPSPLLLFGIVVAFSQVLIGPLVLAGAVGETTVGVFIGALAIVAGYAGTVTLLVVRTGALSWRDMGWPTRDDVSVTRIIDSIALAVVVMPIGIITAGVIGSIVAAALGVQLQSPLPRPRTDADVVALILTAVVLAPLGEELFFRGFCTTAWRIDLGARQALVRSSVFFAAAHLINLTAGTAGEGLTLAAVTFFVYLPLGALLGWLFLRRGIIASIAGHAAANGVVVLLSLLFQPPGAS